MEYLTHERFLEMGGDVQLPLAHFKRLQAECGVMIDYYTFNRTTDTHKDIVERCIFEMIGEQSKPKWKAKDIETKGVKSESVGDYSVSYQGIEDIEKTESALYQSLVQIIRKHFLHTGLMYRGRL